MPDCINGVPYASGACIWDPRQIAQQIASPPVMRGDDGSLKKIKTPAAPRGATFGSFPNEEKPTLYNPGHEFDAMQSAWAMLEEHDQRIFDAGQRPDLEPMGRHRLWWSYYAVSMTQFVSDDLRSAQGLDPEITFTADGIPTFNPHQLYLRDLRAGIGEIKTADERALEEILAVYGKTRTTAEISATLATNPFASNAWQEWLNQQLGPSTVTTDLSKLSTDDVTTGTAPAPILGDVNTPIKDRPDLPNVGSNVQSTQAQIAAEGRDALRQVSMAPDLYLKDEGAAAKQQAELRDFFYWKANYPQVQILAEYNPAFVPPSQLNTAWDYARGNPPLVNVTFTPRVKPPPKKPLLSNPLINVFLEIAALAIPAVGPIISAGISYATSTELRKWAQKWGQQSNLGKFDPQYAPPHGHGGEPFNLPMPLDRAQIMVREPWYGPAMVDQFAEEVRVNQLRQASAAYAALVASGTRALTSGTTSSNATQAQGGATNIKGTIPSPITQAPASGALPILLAGALLVAGAPIVVPLGVLVLLGRKK